MALAAGYVEDQAVHNRRIGHPREPTFLTIGATHWVRSASHPDPFPAPEPIAPAVSCVVSAALRRQRLRMARSRKMLFKLRSRPPHDTYYRTPHDPAPRHFAISPFRHFAISPEIVRALADGQPVVALESTIITHGMPHPANIDTARAVETDIREAGAIPATIAVFGGLIRVGLSSAELDWLASQSDMLKLSRADLAVALVEGRTGSTTVAATMIAANLAGIEVFATGGIGGVHRGAAENFDISADLEELARTPVTVVASGAKAILDLPATLEVLETKGVPVIAFGQDDLPAFWSRRSGLRAPLRLDDPAAIASAHRMRQHLGLRGGQFVTNPIPADEEIPREVIAPLVEEALDAARAAGMAGKAVTPFLLAHIAEHSKGAALVANIALVRENARLAARIARELTRQQTG